MIVADFLERNAELYATETALIELNPAENPERVSWKEFNLIQSNRFSPARTEISWQVFNEKAP